MAVSNLIVVAPHDAAQKIIQLGFTPGRATAFTVTLSRSFADDAAARKVGLNLPYVWAIEHPAS